jgi:regulator of extracellular matrix RemA (YlzA/DUF370 family)
MESNAGDWGEGREQAMTIELLAVGFRNFIALNRVIAIVSAGSAPIQRLVREGKKKGTVIDITSGRRTKAAIFMDNGRIILTAITPETISGRVAAVGQEGVHARASREEEG